MPWLCICVCVRSCVSWDWDLGCFSFFSSLDHALFPFPLPLSPCLVAAAARAFWFGQSEGRGCVRTAYSLGKSIYCCWSSCAMQSCARVFPVFPVYVRQDGQWKR